MCKKQKKDLFAAVQIPNASSTSMIEEKGEYILLNMAFFKLLNKNNVMIIVRIIFGSQLQISTTNLRMSIDSLVFFCVSDHHGAAAALCGDAIRTMSINFIL